MDKSEWKVHFNKFLKHIAHDLEKGITDHTYDWGSVRVTTNSGVVKVMDNGGLVFKGSLEDLGTEENDYTDSSIANKVRVAGPAVINKISQRINETKQENNTMKNNNTAAAELSTLGKTLASQFQDAGATALKMETGEALLKAVENLILEKAGFFGRVKFKFMPQVLDFMAAAGVSAIAAEYLPENHAATLAAEATRLAAMKGITSILPLTQLVDTITKSGAALESIGNK